MPVRGLRISLSLPGILIVSNDSSFRGMSVASEPGISRFPDAQLRI